MVIKTPIICPHCGKDTGYKTEDFMYMVITHDILCPHCHKVIIRANNGVIWKYNGPTPPQYWTTVR
jgi:phage terminase large subunit GpA-like protein